MKGVDYSKKIFISLFTFLLIFLCLELSLRLVWENYEWWNVHVGTEQYRYPKNNYGFRDYEYTKDKPENTIRIIATGDSFTYGGGIKFDDTWSKRLERSLNIKYSPLTGKKYEVLNISWSGYSTFQEVKMLDFIKEFHPDLLILGYCLNDTEDWARKKHVTSLRNQYNILRKKPNDLLKRLYQHSYLASYVGNKVINVRSALGTIQYYNSIYDDSYSGWKKTSKSLRTFSKQDVPVLVAIFPLLSYPFEKYPFLNIHAKIRAELEKDKLPYIDYYNFFKNEDFMRLQVKPFRDPHPSEIACRIIEEQLFKRITKDYKTILAGAR